MPSTPSTDSVRAITEGLEVDVRSRYDRHWCHGFTVASIDEAGVTIRRESDGSVLPVAFSEADIRPVIGSD